MREVIIIIFYIVDVIVIAYALYIKTTIGILNHNPLPNTQGTVYEDGTFPSNIRVRQPVSMVKTSGSGNIIISVEHQ